MSYQSLFYFLFVSSHRKIALLHKLLNCNYFKSLLINSVSPVQIEKVIIEQKVFIHIFIVCPFNKCREWKKRQRIFISFYVAINAAFIYASHMYTMHHDNVAIRNRMKNKMQFGVRLHLSYGTNLNFQHESNV